MREHAQIHALIITDFTYQNNIDGNFLPTYRLFNFYLQRIYFTSTCIRVTRSRHFQEKARICSEHLVPGSGVS